MSCLNLRLPPAKKAWKSFTSKLQSKLHKIHKSRSTTKKHKYRYNSKPFKPPRPPIFSGQKKKCLLPRSSRNSGTFVIPFMFGRNSGGSSSSSSQIHLQKKTAPVYIDKLFRETTSVTELVTTKLPQTSKNVKLLDGQASTVPGTSKEDVKGADQREVIVEADDMWESLGYASPQMRGIDRRAEEFISSFRAEMQQEEIIARSLYL